MSNTEIDQAFIDKAVADHQAKLLPFSILEPRLVKAVRAMAEQEDISSTKIAIIFGKSRNAVISLCSRVKPPIRLPGATWGSPSAGHKRKHVKTVDADLTGAVKYTKLVNTVNRKRKAQQQGLSMGCPNCGAVAGEACYVVRNDAKVPARRHPERMNGLRTKGIELPAQIRQPKNSNEALGLPNIDMRRPSHVQRHMRFSKFNAAPGVPRCAWNACMAPVLAPGRPYCSDHHRQVYGDKFVCTAVNYVISR